MPVDPQAPWPGLGIVGLHPHGWSKESVEAFRQGLEGLVASVEVKMKAEHPSIRLYTQTIAIGGPNSSTAFPLRSTTAFAVLDVTTYDEAAAFHDGMLKGKDVPYTMVCEGNVEERRKQGGNTGTRVIGYASVKELFAPLAVLDREMSQSLSQDLLLRELAFSVWFPEDTTSIWVVCPQIPDPGEYAGVDSPDYTYLDNFGDTDALLEVLAFLSRLYPRAVIERFTCGDLPRDHTKGNLVVIGGPGSPGDIANVLCKEMMDLTKSRVAYSDDCDTMLVGSGDTSQAAFRATIELAGASGVKDSSYTLRMDHGYFARFPNPLDSDTSVVLVNGLHTGGVSGAAKAFGDGQESLRNFDTLYSSSVNPRAFESHFEVTFLRGVALVPAIAQGQIYPLGPPPRQAPPTATPASAPMARVVDALESVLFVAGDRGGSQRNQIQTPLEFASIESALNASEYGGHIRIELPILAATSATFAEAYSKRPSIIHFAGHGDDRSLSFILDQGLLVTQTPFLRERLAAILRNFPRRVRLCVLNACNSAGIAKFLIDEDVVDATIGWPANVADDVAIAFTRFFYRALGNALPLSKAVSLAIEASAAPEAARLSLRHDALADVPFLHVRSDDHISC